jgi:hypothetical protein
MIPGLTRQLAVPQGFTLSISGAFAILLEHHPDPGAVAIWLFGFGAAVGYAIVASASKAHRSNAAIKSAHGYQLFNLSSIVLVPLVSLIQWWIQIDLLAYPLAGLAVGIAYPLAVSVLFQITRPRPR